MTSNRELAESYLEDAEYSLEEAKEAYKRELYHRVVRRCQECVELSLKATLRLLGIEYPKTRELDEVINISTALAIQRAHSFYGDELRKLPPKRIYRREDAEKALKSAGKV